MAEPYLSEIRMMAFGHAPAGWARCDGALLSVQQNPALFGLLGTTYGGDGTTTFALPDLRGRTPIHAGGGHARGEAGGEAAHALAPAALPEHTHRLRASGSGGTTSAAAGMVFAGTSVSNAYAAAGNLADMSPDALGATGAALPHANLQPYLTLNFCIALQGALPSSD